MGWLDTQREKAQAALLEVAEHKGAVQEAAAAWTADCPDVAQHYVTVVNKGAIEMLGFTARLNGYYQNGYRLAHVYEQSGNSVMVLEHNHD